MDYTARQKAKLDTYLLMRKSGRCQGIGRHSELPSPEPIMPWIPEMVHERVFCMVLIIDSREIAELMNKEHRNVLRDIDAMFDHLEGICSDPSIPSEEEYHRGDRTQYKYMKPSAIDALMANASGRQARLRDSFASTNRNEQNGQEYRCYKLPYRETMILVSCYSAEL
jgi:phage regulator Rha-like protein